MRHTSIMTSTTLIMAVLSRNIVGRKVVNIYILFARESKQHNLGPQQPRINWLFHSVPLLILKLYPDIPDFHQ